MLLNRGESPFMATPRHLRGKPKLPLWVHDLGGVGVRRHQSRGFGDDLDAGAVRVLAQAPAPGARRRDA